MSLLKKHNFHIFIMMSLVIATLMALSAPTSVFAQCVATGDGNGVQCQKLCVGHDCIDSGTVCLEVDGDSLNVTYTTTGGLELKEVQLCIGASITDIPQTKKGNPIPGQFPYKSGPISDTSYSFSVLLSDLGFSCPGVDKTYFVAAHADLDGGEGAWADGDSFADDGQGNWATFFTITLTCNCVEPRPPSECETAFTFGGNYATCFLDIDEEGDGVADFNRWGWTNGALGSGNYIFDIYAAAGQCDLNKGTKVGTLTVDYDGSKATITYNMEDGFTMNETHLYVGNEILPRNNGEYTVAPGQYPFKHEELNGVSIDTYNVEGLTNSIYVVAHAVVCGEF